jgi:LytR cell envelope-related transcriptional attenuator
MRAIPYALSVHHFISTVGADAGFAAIIGLAIVVLLFFAHARETANLRHRATEAEDALHRLEQYVDQIARSGSVRTAEPTPAPASAVAAPAAAFAPSAVPAHAGTAAAVSGRTVTPAPALAPMGAMASAPGAPAGVGAPALSAATRLIPVADDGPIAIRSNLPAAVAARSGSGAAAAVMDPPGPPPSTSAGGANGNRIPPAPPPASAGQTMGGRERLPLRPAAARPAAFSEQRRPGQRPGGSRIGRGAIVLVVALVAVVAVGAFLVLHNSGGGAAKTTTAKHAARTTSATSTRAHESKVSAAGAVTPATVTVAVLNGTSTTNLAHDISQKLQAAGFKQGNIATATDQTQNSTIVGYLPSYKRDAQAVAKSLKLAPGSVQAVDPNNRTVACSGSATSCPAQVVVTVGADLASHA